MVSPLSTPHRRYLLATLSPLLALAISWLIQHSISISPPFMTFLAAIMLTAWHAGLGPALLTMSLSIFFFASCCTRPIFPLSGTTASDVATLVLFALQGMLAAYGVIYLQRARHRAIRAHQQLQQLLSLSRLLFEEKDLDHMLQRVLAASMNLLHADKGFIQLYDETTESLSAVAELGFKHGFLTEFDRVPVTFSTCGAAVQRRQRVIVGNIKLDSQFSHLTPLFTRYDVAAVQSTPLLQINGKVLGVLSTYCSKPHVLPQEGLDLLDLYAHEAERVLEAKQREEKLRGANRDLVKVAEIHRKRLISKEEMLRGLVSELAGTEQRERRHLAEELHDYLAQLLTAAKMKLRLAQDCMKQQPWSDADRYLIETDDALKKSLEYTRTLMAVLSPRELLESGLPAALRWLAGQMPKHGLDVAMSISCESLPLSKEHVIILFQSVRELLTNVAKHASVKQASVSLSVNAENTLLITVEDDGRGFTPSAVAPNGAGDHFGLASIRERMMLLGGNLEVDSRPRGGTLMTLSVPLRALLHIVKLRAASSAPKDRVNGRRVECSNQQSLSLDTPSEE